MNYIFHIIIIIIIIIIIYVQKERVKNSGLSNSLTAKFRWTRIDYRYYRFSCD